MIKKNKIKIKLNGKIMFVNSKLSIKDLINVLKIPLNKVAIEKNKKIINKKKLNKEYLKSNDSIEIVHFIGGG